MAVYSEFPIRDQDGETRQTLDLLHHWRPVSRGPIRFRLGRALVAVGEVLQRTGPIRQAAQTPRSHCGLR